MTESKIAGAIKTPTYRQGNWFKGTEVHVSCIRLEQIVGEHKIIERLRRELKVSFSQQAAGLFSEEGLRLMAKYHPIWVTPEGEDLWCFGQLRYLSLYKSGLPGTMEVPVLIFPRVKKRQIEESFHQELLLAPEVYFLTGNDRRHMGWQWRNQSNAAFLTKTIRKPGLKTLAEMLGCEQRTLKEGKTYA